MKNEKILVNCVDHWEFWPGEQVNDLFAVNMTYAGAGSNWKVTHTASGFSVGVYSLYQSKAEAVAFADILDLFLIDANLDTEFDCESPSKRTLAKVKPYVLEARDWVEAGYRA